jgi:hypothetical protein
MAAVGHECPGGALNLRIGSFVSRGGLGAGWAVALSLVTGPRQQSNPRAKPAAAMTAVTPPTFRNPPADPASRR